MCRNVSVWTFYQHTSFMKAYQQECKLNIAAVFVNTLENSGWHVHFSLLLRYASALLKYYMNIKKWTKQHPYTHLTRERKAHNWQCVDNHRAPSSKIGATVHFPYLAQSLSTASCQVFLSVKNVLPHIGSPFTVHFLFSMLMAPNIFFWVFIYSKE